MWSRSGLGGDSSAATRYSPVCPTSLLLRPVAIFPLYSNRPTHQRRRREKRSSRRRASAAPISVVVITPSSYSRLDKYRRSISSRMPNINREMFGFMIPVHGSQFTVHGFSGAIFFLNSYGWKTTFLPGAESVGNKITGIFLWSAAA